MASLAPLTLTDLVSARLGVGGCEGHIGLPVCKYLPSALLLLLVLVIVQSECTRLHLPAFQVTRDLPALYLFFYERVLAL